MNRATAGSSVGSRHWAPGPRGTVPLPICIWVLLTPVILPIKLTLIREADAETQG